MLEAWRKPDTIIVHERCWNSLAKHADIVLPCTLGLERNDIAISSRDAYVITMQKATEPPEGARHDYDILSDIAFKMGEGEAFTEGKNEAQWLDWIYQTTLDNVAKRGFDRHTYDELKAKGWFRPEPPKDPIIMLKDFIDDPEQYPRPTPTGKIEIYSPMVAGFDYDDCLGHPV